METLAGNAAQLGNQIVPKSRTRTSVLEEEKLKLGHHRFPSSGVLSNDKISVD